jgi:hypothetical protein
MTTPDDTAPRRSLSKDLHDIWQVAGLLALVITFVTFGTSAVLSAVIEPATTVSGIVFGTWPLVISATVFTLMVMRGAFRKDLPPGPGYLYVFAIVVFPYIIAHVAGAVDLYESQEMDEASDWNIFGQLLNAMLSMIFGIIRYYFISFGVGRTLLAVLCGVFLAWALQYKLLPHAERLIARRATTAPTVSKQNDPNAMG